jgi:hypothetical protein
MNPFIIILGLPIVIAGIYFSSIEKPRSSTPIQCGYTIIEAGKGLNCKGDTIIIGKIHQDILALY